MDNFSNKSVNIGSYCEEIKVDVSTLIKTIDNYLRPIITDRSTKSKPTKIIQSLIPIPTSIEKKCRLFPFAPHDIEHNIITERRTYAQIRENTMLPDSL